MANLIFLGFLIAIFYFMLIRPQKKRVQAHRDLMSSLNVGDEIVTIGGLFGFIRALRDEDVEIEIASGTKVRIVRSAVARKVSPEVEAEAFGDSGGETA